MESETGRIFQASTPKSKMKPYMILKSTEAIVIQNIFHVEPQFYSDEFLITSDIIRVSGGDGEGDFGFRTSVNVEIGQAWAGHFFWPRNYKTL